MNTATLRSTELLTAFGQRAEREPHLLSRGASWLLLACAAYLVIPLLEVPLWGISLSTPVLCLIALELLLAGSRVHWEHYDPWLLLAVVFWAGQFLSVAGNVFTGRVTELAPSDFVWLTRFAYWMVIFLVTTIVVADSNLGERLARVLGWAVVTLGALRLFEAIALGHWGAGKAFFAYQNSYGWLFSTFTPFAVWLLLCSRGMKRWLAAVGTVVLLAAVVVNGSRSSWIAVSAGLLLLAGLLVLSGWRPSIGWRTPLVVAIGVAVLVLVVLPSSLWSPIEERFATFQRLDRDKPYAVRRLMLQKGLRLFQDNLAWGVGVGRFRSTEAHLEIPPLLRYLPAQRYNERSAHNSYIALLAESGVVGALPWVLLLSILSLRGFVAAVRPSRQGDGWGLPLYAAFVSMSIHFWAVSGLTNTATWFVYGMLAGLIQRGSRIGYDGRCAQRTGARFLKE